MSNGATCDRKNSNGGRFFFSSSFFLIASGSVRIRSRSSSCVVSCAGRNGPRPGPAPRRGQAIRHRRGRRCARFTAGRPPPRAVAPTDRGGPFGAVMSIRPSSPDDCNTCRIRPEGSAAARSRRAPSIAQPDPIRHGRRAPAWISAPSIRGGGGRSTSLRSRGLPSRGDDRAHRPAIQRPAEPHASGARPARCDSNTGYSQSS